MAQPEMALLVKRAQRGDRAAFESLVQGAARMVFAQIVARVRDRQKAEDLTQETFVLAWRGIGGVDKPEGFNSWLLTLARNATLDALRFENRKKRQKEGSGGPLEGEAARGGGDPGEAAELAEARDRALALLEELPEEYRRPLAMRYLAGADYATIRAQLGVSDGALRGALSRGMALLRERMTKGEAR